MARRKRRRDRKADQHEPPIRAERPAPEPKWDRRDFMTLAGLALMLAESKLVANLLSLMHERSPTPVTGSGAATLPALTAAARGVHLAGTIEARGGMTASLTVGPRAEQ